MVTMNEWKGLNEKKIGGRLQMFLFPSLSESAVDRHPGCVCARKITRRFDTVTESLEKSTAKWRFEETRARPGVEVEVEEL